MEIENQMELRLKEIKENNGNSKFFSKDFIQGMIVGILIFALGFAIYWKFFN